MAGGFLRMCLVGGAIALLSTACGKPTDSASQSVSPTASPPTSVVSQLPAATPPPTATSPSPTNDTAATPKPAECSNPQTQAEMNACAAELAKEADTRLNQVYQQTRQKYDGTDQEKQLVDAQLAWIQFRDANCAFSSSRFEGGSIAPLVYSSCIERMTKQRTEELQKFADGLESGGLF